jgi:thioesterase domain-containing protein
LRVLIAAGEALSSDLAERWGRGRRLINAYGPCEVTVCATLGDYHPGEGTPGIGGPIAGTAALVVDRQGQWAIPGSDGELWIGGAGVGLGYVGLEALTKDRFVTDPRPGVEGRVYRSGDVVRARANGGLRFIGRDDRQVKVRGTRIELDEIERVLQGLPGVAHAAVRVVPDGLGAPLVAAWASGAGATSADALRRGLAEHLPETMLPSRLIVVDTMPMTATGKVDRMALSDSGPEADGTGEIAPVGPMETAIAAKMAEVLGLSHPPGRFDNFFTLGGHSILAVRLAATLSETLGQTIPLPRLFAHPTPAALAAALAARPSEAPRGIRTLRAGSGRVGFLVHAVDGTGQAYAPLAAAWPTDRRLVAVEQERDFETLEELAAAHAAEIDRVVEAEAPGAPVDLLGWSLGATVAAAIAGQLRTRGRTVALVVVDATPPSPTATSGVEEDALAEAAAAVGGGADLVARVRRNVRLAEGAALGRLPGGVGVIRAEGTPRPEATPDLGWGAVFDRVEVASAVGDHLTVLKADPATLAARIEAMWQAMGKAMGKEGTPCAT